MSLNSCREEEHAPLHVHRTALPFYMMSLGRWKSTKRSDQELQCPLFSIIAMNDIHPKERIVQLHTLTSIISVFLTSLNINVWGACVLSDTFRDKKNLEDGHTHTLAMWQFLVGSFQRKKAEHALVWKEESSPLSLHSHLLRCLRSCSRDWNLFVYFVLLNFMSIFCQKPASPLP